MYNFGYGFIAGVVALGILMLISEWGASGIEACL